jgi:hypothetical protein
MKRLQDWSRSSSPEGFRMPAFSFCRSVWTLGLILLGYLVFQLGPPGDRFNASWDGLEVFLDSAAVGRLARTAREARNKLCNRDIRACTLVLEMYWILMSIGISFPIIDPFLIGFCRRHSRCF